jgi:hypothetical protein
MCGRDRKRLFCVVGVCDEDFVLLANGDLRKLDRPKRKRLKHLQFTGARIEIPRDDETLRRRIADYEFEARRDYSAEG